jgi:integrase
MAKLTARRVEAIRTPGRYADGLGLHLVVRQTGSKSWVLRTTIDGKRRDAGLGGYPTVKLARARELAMELRLEVAEGRDPRAQRRRSEVPTFRQAAERYVTTNAARWRNPKTAINWHGSLTIHAFPLLGDLRVDEIVRGDVVAVLDPVWTERPAAARKLRQHIKAVFSDAMARGHIEVNPAGDVIDAALPKMPAVKSHFRALPYAEVGPALETIEADAASWASRLCLRFLVLTAARSGEARGAAWDEIDLQARTWTIQPERMKANRAHRVPLSGQAVDVLREAARLRDESGLVFPSTLRPGRPLSDMTLTKLLRDHDLADRATVHGFRTSFKTWTMEATDTPWAVGEAALAHSLGDATAQAYSRSDLFERRRQLMQSWADYIAST